MIRLHRSCGSDGSLNVIAGRWLRKSHQWSTPLILVGISMLWLNPTLLYSMSLLCLLSFGCGSSSWLTGSWFVVLMFFLVEALLLSLELVTFEVYRADLSSVLVWWWSSRLTVLYFLYLCGSIPRRVEGLFLLRFGLKGKAHGLTIVAIFLALYYRVEIVKLFCVSFGYTSHWQSRVFNAVECHSIHCYYEYRLKGNVYWFPSL